MARCWGTRRQSPLDRWTGQSPGPGPSRAAAHCQGGWGQATQPVLGYPCLVLWGQPSRPLALPPGSRGLRGGGWGGMGGGNGEGTHPGSLFTDLNEITKAFY